MKMNTLMYSTVIIGLGVAGYNIEEEGPTEMEELKEPEHKEDIGDNISILPKMVITAED
jgi:hypothetical protein